MDRLPDPPATAGPAPSRHLDQEAERAQMKERKPSADGITANPDFVKLWVGETISLTGTQVTMFALPLIGVLTLHASVFQVGLLNAMRTIPVLFFSLFAGAWLDRRRRRPVMIFCSLGNAILIGLVPLSYGLGLLTLALLFVVCIISGVLSVVFDVGVQTYVPGIIERQHHGSIGIDDAPGGGARFEIRFPGINNG